MVHGRVAVGHGAGNKGITTASSRNSASAVVGVAAAVVVGDDASGEGNGGEDGELHVGYGRRDGLRGFNWAN